MSRSGRCSERLGNGGFSSALEDLLGDLDGGHCSRPAGVEREVDDDLLQFGFGQAVLPRSLKMPGQLLGVAAGDERGDGVIRLRSRGESSGRAQMSPNRTSSVSDTSFGEKSPISCWARVWGSSSVLIRVSVSLGKEVVCG